MQVVADLIDPARATALNVTLGREGAFAEGDALPPFYHQIYFWEPVAAPGLGRDGHPRVGGLIPDMGLPRRMWAGGRLEFSQPLRAGLPAEKRSSVDTAQRKEGRSGPLGFVTLRHEIWQDGQLCLTEWKDLVYREDPDPAAPQPQAQKARQDETSARVQGFTSTMLFRYSALTFNGHRIHYDRDYAKSVEGYGGLVVHGPLLAQLLMLMAEEEMGPLAAFSFRATSALMDGEEATLCRNGQALWVRGPDGRQNMQAEAAASE
ncbi:FAS1-like dehydratase domain-containing protein [Aestuariivita boseongensis]|uniref:FAS1-like dehydratase domain-containing protein n=1 Tax=Aestuariivita boseongensis TaxID=1470562 RepID=UPI00068177DF|nr:MaoC family dehydratase N-terminal domain-containing protein [Aestuariivita boseongensis]